jgi:transcriptional regulator with XRE-family HTH domain
MNAPKPITLGQLIQRRRTELGLSLSEIARRAGIDKGTISLLERGKNTHPTPHVLRSLADGLEMTVADLFASADYLQATELPSLLPYMRAKYQDLPDSAVAEVEQFIQELAYRHHIGTPLNHEDET